MYNHITVILHTLEQGEQQKTDIKFVWLLTMCYTKQISRFVVMWLALSKIHCFPKTLMKGNKMKLMCRLVLGSMLQHI